MLRTMLDLECDHCGNPFTAYGVCVLPVDGAIFTAAMLRHEANQRGWTRRKTVSGLSDLCGRCKKTHTKLKKGGA